MNRNWISVITGASISMAAAAMSQAALAVCDWPISSDPNLVNIAFPDTNATYWSANIPAVPGARLRIEGRYPNARYFSYNVYDGNLRPNDAIADVELVPDAGGHNSFADRDAHFGDSYTAYVEIGRAPENGRDQNTIYTGVQRVGTAETVDIPVIGMLYRVYVSNSRNVLDGGVGLPKLVLEAPEGDTEIAFKRCGPFNESPTGDSTVNDETRNISAPLPQEANQVPYLLGARELTFQKFYGFGNTLARMGGSAIDQLQPGEALVDGDSFQSTPITGESNGGFLSNIHNAYGTFLARRDMGSMYVVRGKAPTWEGAPSLDAKPRGPRGPGAGNGASNRNRATSSAAQLRYWSMCTNEFHTTRYVGCLRDSELVLDEDGYYTLIVSDLDQRPTQANAVDGINWLPWGGLYYDSVFIYRHMLPDPDFMESIQNVQFGEDPRASMGDYAPSATYCDKATVERVAPGPRLGARVMEACISAR